MSSVNKVDSNGNLIEIANKTTEQYFFTRAEWDAIVDKSIYDGSIINITDDYASGVGVVVDEATLGNMSAITSNAVAEAIDEVNSDLNKHSFGTPVSLTANVTFTAPSDGYIRLLCMPDKTATAWADVNGIEKLLQLASENGYGQGMGSAFSEVVMVKKGMTINFNGTHGATCTFYPLT